MAEMGRKPTFKVYINFINFIGRMKINLYATFVDSVNPFIFEV